MEKKSTINGHSFTIKSALLFGTLFLCTFFSKAQTVSTLAGISGESFNNPGGMAIDASGNIYIADALNHVIRKVSSSGVISTFAGLVGTFGNTDATGTAARFHSPISVTLDGSGNVYVADQLNHKIRKITSAGVVTTLAGSGTTGSVDATGTGASFNTPHDVAVDGSGNVFVADEYNHRIRKITPAGVVTTLAGSATVGSLDGTGTGATFGLPMGITIDPSGNLYVVDFNNNNIRKITSAGVVTTLAGSGTAGYADGTGAAAMFRQPYGIEADATGSTLYVADISNNRIRAVTSAGVVTTFAGSGASGQINGTGTAATFDLPTGVALDASGNVFISEGNNNVIRKITTAGVVTTFAGTQGTVDGTGAAASFNTPYGTAVDGAGNVYAIDYNSGELRKISPSGVVTTLVTPGTFKLPTGIAIDPSGNLYVPDYNNYIYKVTPAGTTSIYAGNGYAGFNNSTDPLFASFYQPAGVCADAAGNLYVADFSDHRIRKIDANGGAVTTLAGSSAQGSTDGTGAAAKFYYPTGVAVDLSGNVYVADRSNHKIRKITSAGVVTTLAGSGIAGSVDGTGAAATFNSPSGVAVDGSGNVFVTENSAKIRKITPAGVVTTIAGSALLGSLDGVGAAASFYSPRGLATNGAEIYVADADNDKIRKITLPCSSSIPSAATASTTVQPTCGTPTGTIDITAPTGAYQYSMDGSLYQTSTTFTLASPGVSHSILVRSATDNPCISSASSVAVNSVPPSPATPTASTTTQPSCSAATGTITVTAPIGAYDYSINGTTYQASTSFTGIAPSTVSVTARSSADHACISVAASVVVNSTLAISAAPTASTTIQPTIAVPTGTIVVTAPTGSYEYSVDGQTYQATTSFTGLAPGMSHTITARSTVDISCVSPMANVTVNAVPSSTPTGVNTGILKSTGNIYPNPAGKEAYIRLPEEMKNQSNYKVTILDGSGKPVEISHYEGTSEVLRLNIESLQKGVYQVIIRTEDRNMTDKLVIIE